jgi:uncharacterized membrane protein
VADVAAALGAGLSAGVYPAFPAFVMPGPRKLPPAHAISAMSSTSKAAPGSPLLMLVPSGTGIVCVLVMIAGFAHKGDPAAVRQIAGAALYLISVLILAGYHVPHNDQLMKADPTPPGQVPPGRTPARHGWPGTTPARWPLPAAPPAASSPCEHAKHRSVGHEHAPTRRWSGTSCPAAGHRAPNLASQPGQRC